MNALIGLGFAFLGAVAICARLMLGMASDLTKAERGGEC